jgi:transcriptional regulator GlxA family with amidase domain
MALLRAKSYTPISEIASAFGFRQRGQYSRDYRRWFGETPSKTLARI